MDAEGKQGTYDLVLRRIRDVTSGETDLIALMATAVCELHNGIDYFAWSGFYRVVERELLKIGPYQGAHACLQIPFDKGVCGAAARLQRTQIVSDVRQFPGYIACAASTRSEIAVPVFAPEGHLIAVLDVDSDQLSSFDEVDRVNLEKVCRIVGCAGRGRDAAPSHGPSK